MVREPRRCGGGANSKQQSAKTKSKERGQGPFLTQRHSNLSPDCLLFAVCCLLFAACFSRHHKLLVVIEAFENVGDVVDGFKATTEANLYHRVIRVLLS
jgi:hypothetical protein